MHKLLFKVWPSFRQTTRLVWRQCEWLLCAVDVDVGGVFVFMCWFHTHIFK